MRHAPIALALALALALAALSPTPARAQVQTPCPALWTIDRGTVFDHSDAPLTELADVVVDRRGRVAVGDEKTNTIYLFWNGRLSGSLGRAGEGPGEFRHPDNMMALGDSLFVVDTRLQRATVFAPDGSVARTVSFARSYAPFFMGEVFPFGDGYMMMPNPPAQLAIGEDGYTLPLLRLAADGSIRDTIGAPLHFRGTIAAIALPGGIQSFTPLPTPQFDAARVDPAGDGVVFATGRIDDERRLLTVTRIGTGGDTIFTRTFELPPARYSEAALDSALDAIVSRIAQRIGSDRDVRAAVEKAWWVSEDVWPVQGMIVDNDSRIWIRTTSPANHWLVLDAAGTPVGCVNLPVTVKPYAAQAGDLWTVRTDPDGVPTIVQYRISRD